MPASKKRSAKKKAAVGQSSVAKAKLPADVIREAQLSGMMPADILLAAARGQRFVCKAKHVETDADGKISVSFEDYDYYPSYQEQISAAIAAAPLFHPKLAATQVSVEAPKAPAVMMVPAISADDWERSALESQTNLIEGVRDDSD